MTDLEVRKLIVTGQKDLATLANGSILYEVTATDADGEVIDLPFRAFAELTIGEVAEYQVQPYDHPDPKYGRTYTLIPKERESRTKQLTKKVRELEERLNDIENSLDARIAAIVQQEIQENQPDPFVET